MKVQSFILSAFAAILITGCRPSESTEKIVYNTIPRENLPVIADTIIYDVIIKNLNKEDLWTEECLQQLKRNTFLDSLFTAIYNEQILVFDFFTKEKLTPRDIKKMETAEGYSRDAIGKIQFTEVWYFDSSKALLEKKVVAMVLGLEQFTSTGELKGYKPLFRVNLN